MICSPAKISKELSVVPHWPAWLTTFSGNLSLNLNFNLIKRIEPFPAVTQLQQISITHNRVSSIAAKAFGRLPSLLRLVLNNNELQRLNEMAFAKDTENGVVLPLEHLDLSYNELHSLDEDLFDTLPNLHTLLLNDNPLKALDASTQSALNALPRLHTLSLAQTGLADLPNLVNPIRHLKTLFLDGNVFKTVPKVVQHAQELKALGLNDNPIEQLNEGDFEGLKQLERLNLSSMPKLKAIHKGTFAPLKNLRSLLCSHNRKLTLVSPEAFKSGDKLAGAHLHQVSLHDNQLHTLSQDLLPWVTIEKVELHDNPWRCDCRIRWMKKLRPTADHMAFLRCDNTAKDSLLNVSDDTFARCPADMAAPVAHTSSSDRGVRVNAALVVAICVAVLSLALGIAVGAHLVKRRNRRLNAFRSRVTYSKTSNEETDFFD